MTSGVCVGFHHQGLVNPAPMQDTGVLRTQHRDDVTMSVRTRVKVLCKSGRRVVAVCFLDDVFAMPQDECLKMKKLPASHIDQVVPSKMWRARAGSWYRERRIVCRRLRDLDPLWLQADV